MPLAYSGCKRGRIPVKKPLFCFVLAMLLLVTSSVAVSAAEAEPQARSVQLSTAAATVRVDQSRTLSAYVTPLAADQSVCWESSDSEVVLVEDGTLVGVSPGTAVVTATSGDGKRSARCTVTMPDTVFADPGPKALSPGEHPCASATGGEQLHAAALRADAQALFAAGSAPCRLTYRDKTTVSAAALRGADYAARAAGKALTLAFDTLGDGGEIQGRLTVDTGLLRGTQTDLCPTVKTQGADLEAVALQAQALLGRPAAGVSCSQAGAYGASVQIGVPVGAALGEGPRQVYALEPKTGELVLLEGAQPRQDQRGWVYFQGTEGGVYAIL